MVKIEKNVPKPAFRPRGAWIPVIRKMVVGDSVALGPLEARSLVNCIYQAGGRAMQRRLSDGKVRVWLTDNIVDAEQKRRRK